MIFVVYCFTVIPQPVYMNAEELEMLRRQQQGKTAASSLDDNKSDELLPDPEDDLKTPTIEELAFPGQHRIVS